jgi:hypothetical protein
VQNNSQEVQRARRVAAGDPAELADLAANPPLAEGDASGAIQWTNFRTGKVTRWTVLRGDRTNNYRLRSPNVRMTARVGIHAGETGFTRTIMHSTGTPTFSPPEYLAGRPYTIQGDRKGKTTGGNDAGARRMAGLPAGLGTF